MNNALTYLYQEDIYQVPAKVTVILKNQLDSYTLEQRALLAKILGSVKLSMASVQIISQQRVSLDSFHWQNTTKILVFGAIGAEFPLYQAIQAQGFSVIQADDLTDLDDQKKKSLWLALKNMFGL